MEIITQEHLASNFIKSILAELWQEYEMSGLAYDHENGSSFDDFVWNRLQDLGQATYEAIGAKYGDLDGAVNEVME